MIAKAAILVFLILFQASCSYECWSRPGKNEYREIEKLLDTNTDIGTKTFSELPVDIQIAIFLYARSCPDDPRIRPLLVRNGEAKIPEIVDRIKMQGKMWERVFLMGILLDINAHCRCIPADSQVVKDLEEVGRPFIDDSIILEQYSYEQMYKDELYSLKNQLE